MSNEKNNNQNSSIDTKDFLIGSLIGGIVGATTALLLAPKSGKELRTDLNDQAVQLKGKSTEVASMAKEKSSNIAQTVSTQTSQAANKVKEFSSNVKDDYANWRNKDKEAELLEEEYNEGKADAIEDAMQTPNKDLNNLETNYEEKHTTKSK
ncbi:YtxH domain-containing protein [Pseudalkalibacillus berkeleyi]|uniref:YtxH domain-containing protein n=1 Tax=Pseudalkalibacillus berkeleyi TaxID=1069813 RepID=A0ABS9H373_9BACL|nr:YtxH domain-containing protein [Pseudalkalibacillus berkeleyi]MCF6138303.1 YtxH domain-containing protein [Pseudalkalibacillus berkeleyi]